MAFGRSWVCVVFNIHIFIIYLMYAYGCFACMFVSYVCVVSIEVRKGYRVFWNWSYRMVVIYICVLGVKPGSCRRGASILNH